MMMMMVMKPQALCTALALVRHEQLYVILAFRSTTISGRSTFTMDYGQDELAYLDNIRISTLPPFSLLLSTPPPPTPDDALRLFNHWPTPDRSLKTPHSPPGFILLNPQEKPSPAQFPHPDPHSLQSRQLVHNFM